MPRRIKCPDGSVPSRKPFLLQRSAGVMALAGIVKNDAWPHIYNARFLGLDYVPHCAKTRMVKRGSQVKACGFLFIGPRVPPSYASISLASSNNIGYKCLCKGDAREIFFKRYNESLRPFDGGQRQYLRPARRSELFKCGFDIHFSLTSQVSQDSGWGEACVSTTRDIRGRYAGASGSAISYP